MRRRLAQAVSARGRDARLLERAGLFCFKHDLESLLLAAEEELAARLETPVADLRGRWTRPVEDQDHDRPPKRVVEELFAARGRRYEPTVDAPLILRDASLDQVVERCPQCFRPFVEWLRALPSEPR